MSYNQQKVKIQHWQRQFQNLKLQNIQITQKYEKRLKQIKKQKKQIKQTFRIVQQNTQIERMLLQNLQLQKQQINQLILSQKSTKFLYYLEQKKQLFDQLTQLKQKNEQNNIKLTAANNKIIWQDKQIKILNQQIKQKDNKFKQLQRQIYQFNKNKQQQQQNNQLINKQQKQKINNFLFNNNNNNQDKNQQQTNRRISFVQINPLSDQIIGFQDYQMRKSFISIARSDGKSPNDYDPINKSVINQEQEEDISKIKSKFVQKYRPTQINIPNFYFAHYLLTCQSVKLKLNQERFLCLDMSIYYKEILDSKIPFHMWDQWIIKKLKQIANNQ